MIVINADLSEVAAFIGTSQGFLEEVDSQPYLHDMLDGAHASAKGDFDIAAATHAAGTGTLSHVYEWGTAGINEAPGKPTLDPLSPVAKLWVHKFTGRGGHRNIDFELRASKVSVPLPEVDSDGVDDDYGSDRSPKRKHIFYWKAPIIEYGMSVTIKPKYAQAMFIPLRGDIYTDNSRGIERGYIMTSKPITMVPGATLRGNFTGFWQAWWSTMGANQIADYIDRNTYIDADAVIADNSIEARKVAGKGGKSFLMKVNSSKSLARFEMAKRRRARRAAARAKTEFTRGKVWRG